jgi:hypothetical protein
MGDLSAIALAAEEVCLASLSEILFVSIRVHSRFLFVPIRGYETVFS